MIRQNLVTEVDQPISPLIRDVPVMSRKDRVVYACGMLAWVGLLVSLSAHWFVVARASHHLLLAFLIYPLALQAAMKITLEWYKAFRMRRPEPVPPGPGHRVAMVTTFVPRAEPLAMLEATLTAMVCVSYPHDNYVLDEGDDPSVRALCERVGALHCTRKGRPEFNEKATGGWFPVGMKVGNLNAWLHSVGFSGYDFVAFIDPDHVPLPIFLDQTLGYFEDATVGYVQAPQVYYNQGSSFIARGAAEQTYFYYGPYNMAAYGVGAPIIDGCHTTLRIDALRRLGGYSVHDGEDLMLTHEFLAAGVRGVYVPRVLARGLAPEGWLAYLRQQYQWAFVTMDIKLWRFTRIRGRVRPLAQLILVFHGLGYLSSISRPARYLLTGAILLFWTVPPLSVPILLHLGALFVIGLSMALWLQKFHVVPATERGIFWRARLLELARWPYVLAGVVTALMHRPIERRVTPKQAARLSSLRPFSAQAVALLVVAACVGLSFGRDDPSLLPVRAYAIGGCLMNALILGTALFLRPRERLRYGPQTDTSDSGG